MFDRYKYKERKQTGAGIRLHFHRRTVADAGFSRPFMLERSNQSAVTNARESARKIPPRYAQRRHYTQRVKAVALFSQKSTKK